MSKYSEKKRRRIAGMAGEQEPASREAVAQPAAAGPATQASGNAVAQPTAAGSATQASRNAMAQPTAASPARGRAPSPLRTAGVVPKRVVQSSRTTAAAIGGFGPCGRPICCAGWLKNAEELKVSIRMAKAQTVSLAPESINGYCCQMKCCFAFEYGHEGCFLCRRAGNQGAGAGNQGAESSGAAVRSGAGRAAPGVPSPGSSQGCVGAAPGVPSPGSSQGCGGAAPDPLPAT